MTSIPGSQIISTPSVWPSATRNIFLVLGLACIVGFVANFLTLIIISPDPMALEWRLDVMQQVSGRSIVLFFGAALVLYSLLDQPTIARGLALACLITGVVFLLSGVLVIRDGITLQNQAVGTIESQSEAIRSQLESAAPGANFPPEITPERIKEALPQLEQQTETLKQNARGSAVRAMISVLSRQVIIGLGLVSLGRIGLRHKS
ncbi:MAG: hypothetical protein HC929_05845 [Leptolyngbyaceae cyanobacterium SM2_5_2]|nr:hypothetical protein [Leptolyngbyaceae cyanobacterium SM2_5_2]